MLNEGVLNKSKKVTLLLSAEYCTLALNMIAINIISIKVKQQLGNHHSLFTTNFQNIVYE